MDYKLMWAGKLWTIAVPAEINSERLRWTYAQTYVVTGDHVAAMKQVFSLQYPGLGYSGVSLVPVSFVSALGASADAYGSGRSGPSLQSHKGSQRPPHHGAKLVAKGEVSGISDLCKPAPRSATSNASRPLFRQKEKSNPVSVQNAKQNATQGTGGWMGSNPTSA